MWPTKFADPRCMLGDIQLNTDANSYFGDGTRALSTMVGEWGARVVKNKTPVVFSQQNTEQSKSKSGRQKVVILHTPEFPTSTFAPYTSKRCTGSN